LIWRLSSRNMGSLSLVRQNLPSTILSKSECSVIEDDPLLLLLNSI
jgi:hypothetical protein